MLVLERVAIAFRYFSDTGRADMGDKAWRPDSRGEASEVPVTPGWVHRYERDRFVMYFRHIPSHAEAVPVKGFFNFAGIYALIDKRVPGFIEKFVQGD